MKAPCCEIILCELVPRSDADVSEFNIIIYDVACNYGLKFIELYTSFIKHGSYQDRYYSQDGLHLSYSGVRQLLGEINREVTIVADFNTCTFYQNKYQGVKQFPNRVLENTNRPLSDVRRLHGLTM